MSYEILKLVHIGCAIASISGFLLRGYWMLAGSSLLAAKPVRVLPHVVDTVFLASGIALVVTLRLPVLELPWLMAKIALLLVYVVLGSVALKRGRTRRSRATALVLALLIFAWIAGIAMTKSPAAWVA